MHKISKKKKVITFTILAAVVVGCVIVILSFNHKGADDKSTGNKYEVTFLSDDSSVLKVDYVEKDQPAIPPNSPQLTYGNVFIGWDIDISKIVTDTTIKPIVKNVSNQKNVLALPGLYGQKGSTTYGQLSLCGDVNICGFEMTVEYDSEKLSLADITDEDDGVIINGDKPGIIYINYATTNNTTGDVDLCVLGFKPISDAGTSEIKINVTSAYEIVEDDLLEKTDVNTISSVFTVLS